MGSEEVEEQERKGEERRGNTINIALQYLLSPTLLPCFPHLLSHLLFSAIIINNLFVIRLKF